MAYVVVLNLRAMVIRTVVTAGLALVAAAYAEDRFHHHDWRNFAFSVGASAFMLLLCAASVHTINKATSRH